MRGSRRLSFGMDLSLVSCTFDHCGELDDDDDDDETFRKVLQHKLSLQAMQALTS